MSEEKYLGEDRTSMGATRVRPGSGTVACGGGWRCHIFLPIKVSLLSYIILSVRRHSPDK